MTSIGVSVTRVQNQWVFRLLDNIPVVLYRRSSICWSCAFTFLVKLLHSELDCEILTYNRRQDTTDAQDSSKLLRDLMESTSGG